MSIHETLRKIFSKDIDREVSVITNENSRVLKEAGKAIGKHRDLLKKNGVTMPIFIATGGDRRE